MDGAKGGQIESIARMRRAEDNIVIWISWENRCLLEEEVATSQCENCQGNPHRGKVKKNGVG